MLDPRSRWAYKRASPTNAQYNAVNASRIESEQNDRWINESWTHDAKKVDNPVDLEDGIWAFRRHLGLQSTW